MCKKLSKKKRIEIIEIKKKKVNDLPNQGTWFKQYDERSLPLFPAIIILAILFFFILQQHKKLNELSDVQTLIWGRELFLMHFSLLQNL